MAAPEFIVHKETLGEDANKLVLGGTLNTNGVIAGQPAYASDINAILHETSLVVTAIAENMTGSNTITPTSALSTVKTNFTNYIKSIKVNAAGTADAVGHTLSYKINTTTATTWTGSDNKTIGPIYAPTSVGTANAVLKSTGSGAPEWSGLYTEVINPEYGTPYLSIYSTLSKIYFGKASNPTDTNTVMISGDLYGYGKCNIQSKDVDAAIVYGGIKVGANLTGQYDVALNIANNFKIERGLNGTCNVTGSLNFSGGSLSGLNSVSAGSFTATSDVRLKENISDYAPSKSILDLPLKQFDFKSDKSHHIGCIAQDLQQIAPEIVHEDKDGYLNIEETKLVYLLLDEVKKLRKEVDKLKGSK